MKPVIFTIGFTRKTAEEFFERLRVAGVKRVIDVRLHNNSQLAGFSKRDDLAYFLKQIAGINYHHEILLAPTADLLAKYRSDRNWDEYAQGFLRLMEERKIEQKIDRSLLENGCLLCSEDKPHHCHRRLVTEYLHERWENFDVRHL
jgi:uncharacterized protein (DUF488 family)